MVGETIRQHVLRGRSSVWLLVGLFVIAGWAVIPYCSPADFFSTFMETNLAVQEPAASQAWTAAASQNGKLPCELVSSFLIIMLQVPRRCGSVFIVRGLPMGNAYLATQTLVLMAGA